MLTGNDHLRIRTKLVVAVFILIFLGLWGRLYHVQIVRHKELYRKAKNQYTTTRTTITKRGEIFDVKGNLLVGNIPCDDIIADPSITCKDLNKCRQLSKLLAHYLKLDYDTVYKKLSTGSRLVKNEQGEKIYREIRYAIIARKVSLEISKELKKIIFPEKKNKHAGFKGIFFKETYARYYPKGELLANILGFTNVDHDKVVPVLGVERFLDKKISSSKSRLRFERSRDGRCWLTGN